MTWSIGEIYQHYTSSNGFTTDTRNLQEGNMYFALKGSNFNGNSFTEKALNQGAAFAVVDDADFVLNERCILVEDTLTALQSLATDQRRQLKNV